MPTKSGIIGTVKLKMEDGTFVDLPYPISLEEITTFAEQYEYVKVVRCKDCAYRTTVNQPYDIEFCLNLRENIKSFDWYCADGERKGEE